MREDSFHEKNTPACKRLCIVNLKSSRNLKTGWTNEYLQRYCSMGRLPKEGGMRPQKLFEPSDSVPKFFIVEMDEGMLPVRLLSMTSNSARVA